MTARPTITNLPLFLRLQYRPHRHHRRLISTTIRTATIPTPPPLTKRHAIIECLTKLVKWGFAKESLVLLAGRGISADGGAEGGVRVGVLGKGDGLGRVVTALLNDPLEGREAGGEEWVKALRRWCADGGESQGLLIRHGPTSEISTPKNSPVSLLTVPSPLLKPSNIEILLAPIPPGDPTDLTLHVSNIPGSRLIQFPVHKSIVYAGEGETGLQTLLNHDSTTVITKDGNSNARVLRLLSLPASAPENHKIGSVKIVNLATAEDAIKQLKTSAANSLTFERAWLKSGFGAVQEWMLDGCQKPDNDDGGIRPVVEALISSIVAQSERLILEEEERLCCAVEGKKHEKETHSVSEGLSIKAVADNFESLSVSLRNWSQNAHSELQTSLTAGFTSHVWGRLAWWKLIWTADDVTANSREVASACLLPQSKKAFLFLAGRLAGAGFNSPQSAFQRPNSSGEELARFRLADIPSPPSPPLTSKNASEDASEGPYPMHLFTKTDYIVSNLISDLQTSANRVLMGSVSFSVTSAAASSLLYLSGVSVYSSSTVAALGLVLSMRWLQARWGRERQRFQQAVKEQGRIAIVESERWMWQRLKDGLAVDEEEEEIAGKDAELERVLEARAVVGRVTELLGAL